MALSPGDTLGPYEILSAIGAGGMGEVYKARDTRLDRSVAIKVLPDHIAQREDARTRFEREARSVASLNHSSICTLHDIGPNYMVMELIEGETLAARIEKGPIPLDQALNLAIQIADAFDRAHRAGVTHRDIKPQNIMLTRDGVKVLDFGLAKSATAAPGPTEATLTKVLTTEGTVLGTPQYMAPEQFEGKEADARSDIWAFGAVLYEMVTGQKAFQGKNYTSLVAAILGGEPAPMTVKPFAPAWLERLVRRCLQKDPEDRYQSMRDLVIDLKSPPPAAPVAMAKYRWTPATTAAFALVAVLGCALAWTLWTHKPGDAVAPVRLELNPPDGETLSGTGTYALSAGTAISPDGRTLAFVTSRRDDIKLHVRPLDAPNSHELPGTEDAGVPFWSPDSKSIAFVAKGKLKRIDLVGGKPATLCDAGPARGATWSEDGVILFGAQGGGLLRIPDSGGTPTVVTRPNEAEGEQQFWYPQFLPGGKQFLYLARNKDPKKHGIAVGSLDGAPSTFLVSSPSRAIYDASSGRLLYVDEERTLLAQRLELNPPRLSGAAVTVAEGVRASREGHRYADVSVSNTGTLFYAQNTRTTQRSSSRLAWHDRTGKLLETVGEPLTADSVSLSPDGKQVAYDSRSGTGRETDVWVRSTTTGASTRITFHGGVGPKWSADGKYLYFSDSRGERIYRKLADGSGDEEMVSDIPNSGQFSVSADGKVLLSGTVDIYAVPLEGGRKAWAWLKTEEQEGRGALSPDGRWVAYESEESGPREIYIQGFLEKRGKWVVSQGGGRQPRWRADGKELYWRAPGGELMAAPVDLQPSVVRVGKPEALFRLSSPAAASVVEPARDGRRFLVLDREEEGADLPRRDPPMVVVLHWAAGLEK